MSRPRKIRSSTKLAIGFALVVALGYAAYYIGGRMMVDRLEFAELRPAAVNLLGVDTGGGYHILVANQMAHLVEGSSSGEFEGEDKEEEGGGGDDAGGEKKRIPIRELIMALNGDAKAVNRFVTIMNDELKADLPINSEKVTWTFEDVKKAFAGDAQLKEKLESQLNTKLDGTPPDYVTVSAIQTGILLKCPVEMNVPVAGENKTLKDWIYVPYQTSFARRIGNRIREKADDPNFVKGAYLEERAAFASNEKNREDILKALTDRFDPRNLKRYTDAPTRVASHAKIILNDSFIERASSRERKLPNGKKVYDILITVNDEGRKRLWQYSRRNKGKQLLLISNGIPIAAPRITGDMALADVTISGLGDPRLVEDAVNEINHIARDEKT